MKNKFTTLEMVTMAAFAALLCVSSYLSIPNPLAGGAKLTLLNFVVMLIILVFSLRDSFTIIMLWMILGLVGLPVYVGQQSGPGYLFGLYGGYVLSYIVVTILIGLIKGKKYNRIYYTILAIVMAVLVDLIGAAWWKFMGDISWASALTMGFAGFIVFDIIKAVVAAQIAPLFQKLLPKN